MSYLLLTIIGIALNLAIGIFVWRQNSISKLNRSVTLLAFSLVLWQITNYLADHATALTLYWNRATFIGPIFAAYFSGMFLNELRSSKVQLLHRKVNLYISIAVSAFVLFGNVITATHPRFQQGVLVGNDVVRGSGYYLAIFWIGYLILTFLINLLVAAMHSTGKLREQIRVILLGVSVAVAAGILTNVVLPLMTDSTAAAKLAPLTGIVIMATYAFAIVRHGLLDIRTVVIRGALYVLTRTTLGVLYVAPILYVTLTVIMGSPFSWSKFIPAVVLGTIGAMNFERLRKWFDGTTSKIFFQDAYDSALLLGQLNRRLVSTINLPRMLENSADLMVQNIKAEYCVFVLKDAERGTFRVLGSGGDRKFSRTMVSKVEEAVRHVPGKTIVTDYNLSDTPALKAALVESGVGVIVRLSSSDGAKDSLGYMILGYKKSGNPYNNQDLHTLETVTDAMVIAIQNALHYEEIQNFNVTLQRRIDEATAQLRRTNAKLQALDETKDDFISMASHQLRTPLTSVKGYLSMVLEGDAGKLTAMQRKMLDQAFISSQRMVFLIADLLNVSRLKTGKFVIEPTQVNLAKTVADEVNQLKETAKARSLELVYDRPAEFPVLMIDETKIRQVIMNFIDNAIYYTPSGGKITVELTDKASTVEFKVIDTGIGVPKREQPHLFTKFYRAGNARQARPDGTGLGLFMAKKVIIAQGGAVIFDSKESKGSTFGFIFPKAKMLVTQ